MNDMDKRKKICIWAVLAGLVLTAAIAAIVVCVCSAVDGKGSQEEQPQATPRMEDPVYVAQLDALAKRQKTVLTRVAAAKAALKAEESAETPDETKLQSLRAEAEAAGRELEEYRKEADATVRGRIMKEVEEFNRKGSNK